MPRDTPSLVWLFDIDGTLLLTQGAGRDALARALHEVYGIEDDLRTIAFAGRTDVLIIGDIVERHGITFANGDRERFFERVVAHMRTLMDPPRGGLLPGVRVLLDAVAARPEWVSALLTGNESNMARIKLSAFGVWEHFAWGTFGEEGPDRNSIARLAVQRAAERHGVPPERCIVVGDTEFDIECARAAGARAVAVATGGRPRDVLAACAPDLLLETLEPMDVLLEWARSAEHDDPASAAGR